MEGKRYDLCRHCTLTRRYLETKAPNCLGELIVQTRRVAHFITNGKLYICVCADMDPVCFEKTRLYVAVFVDFVFE